jgi:hypothetical protein
MANRAPKDLRRLALAGGAWLVVSCSHTDPFSPPPYGATEPLDPTPPVRLTLNLGPDRDASWLPDGSGILYSTQQAFRSDRDVCLAELPPHGGSQRRLVCDLTALGGDTLNAVEFPVAAADGRLAFLKLGNPTTATRPLVEAVTVAPGLDPRRGSEVVRLPYTVPGEPTHATVTSLRWLSSSRLTFVGSLRTYRNACMLPCTRQDTILSGLKVGVLDLDAPGSAPGLVAGTEFASGVSPGSSGQEIYYTIGGDSRVYRRNLATGEVAVAYDFGAAGIARDVHVVGSRLTAIVGGRAHFIVDPELGPIQADSGGFIHVVDLSSGNDAVLGTFFPATFRHPSLAPAGDRVVAEGYPLIVSDVPGTEPGTVSPDTTVGRDGDLYLFPAP